MKTDRKFQKDPYCKTTEGTVLSVNYDARGTKIVTDCTVFFPTGGGQSCDTGTLTGSDGSVYSVTDVFEDGEAIVHVTDAPEGAFSEGDPVTMTIDWAHRFDNMQRHCGEHILSGAFHRLYGGENHGFHMGEDYITIDIAFPPGGHDKVTWAMAETAEAEANRVITEDLPVHVNYFSTREEAEQYPSRKPIAFAEDISIVTVGDPADPADCCPCCGTHPATTGQIGLLKIYKIESNKGMSRIYFECGARAFRKYQEQFNVLYDISGRFSAGYDELLAKYEAQQAHTEALRAELSSFRSKALAAESAHIASSPDHVFYYDDFSVDDLFNLGKQLGPAITELIVLVHKPSNTAILLSDGSDPARRCGDLVKQNAPGFGGKGGGKPSSARAFFPDRDSLEAFLKVIL